MAPRTYLIAGFLCGAAMGGLFLVGPERLTNVYCRVAGCPSTSDMDDVCDIATRAEALPRQKRPIFMAREFKRLWPAQASVSLAQRVGLAAPGEKYDVILDQLRADGRAGWTCPALARFFFAPVGASMRYVVVDGAPIAQLDQGLVRPADTGESSLVIAPLYDVLRRRTPTNEPLEIGLHPALPYKTILQLVYTAGLAEHEDVDLRILDDNIPAVRIALSPYGVCDDCLAELPEISKPKTKPDNPTLAVVGRRTIDGADADEMLAEDGLRLTIALARSSDVWIAARGGVLPPRSGPEDTATVGAAPDGPNYAEAQLRLDQIRASFPHHRGVVMAADLGTRAGPFVRLMVALHGERKVLEEKTMLAVPIELLDDRGVLDDLFSSAGGVTLSTRAQLANASTPKGAEPSSSPTLASAKRRRARRTPKKRRRLPLLSMFRPHLQTVQSCYERGLAKEPTLAGKVVIHLRVETDGSTASVTAEDRSLGSRDVVRCIERAAEKWQLEPRDEPLTVAYPIVLRPSTI